MEGSLARFTSGTRLKMANPPGFSQGFPMVFPGFPMVFPWFCHQDLGASRARESLTMTKDSDGWKISFLLGCYIYGIDSIDSIDDIP